MALLASTGSGQAQPADIYTGRTLTIVVGLEPGGTADTFVRALAGYLKRHIPGTPTVLAQNMPGAGGLVATNWLAERAPRDGSTIIYHPWDPLAQGLGEKALRVRYETFEVLGGTNDVRAVYARADSVPGGLKAPADIMKAGTLAVGALNPTDLSGLLARLALQVLGVRHKLIVGYRGGSDVFLALQRGEVQVHSTSIASLRTRNAGFLRSGEGLAIAYLATTDKNGATVRNAHIGEMPAFPDLYAQVHGQPPSGAEWTAMSWLVGQVSDLMYVGLAPPGTPAAAVAALRKGIEAASADPELVAYGIKTNGLPYTFVPAEKGKAVIAALAGASPEVLATVRNSIAEAAR